MKKSLLKEVIRIVLTCHPLGIMYPPYSKSFNALLKIPNTGGKILSVSIATFHVYFILARSSYVKDSPEYLLFAISSCFESIATNFLLHHEEMEGT